MAAKTEISGFVRDIGPVQALNGGKHFKQVITVRLPKPKNQFGEEYGRENIYPIQIIRTDKDKFPELKRFQKVKATCYVNGEEWTSSTGIHNNIKLALKDDFEIIQ